MTDLLLEATGIVKRYGAVAALRGASLAVRPGEVHALLGANGAGKSTLVKILTGTVRPDAGTITIRGRDRTIRSPAEARRAGARSPCTRTRRSSRTWTSRDNLRLTDTPVEPFRCLDARAGHRERSTSTTTSATCRCRPCGSSTWRAPSPPSQTSCCWTR